MHYLTNYYKNLCEQLEERIFILQKLLNEVSLGDSESDEEDDDSADVGDFPEEPEQPKSIEDKWLDKTKHIYGEKDAFAIPVPTLRTGKNGNYREWKAANDARNMALKRARSIRRDGIYKPKTSRPKPEKIDIDSKPTSPIKRSPFDFIDDRYGKKKFPEYTSGKPMDKFWRYARRPIDGFGSFDKYFE